MARRPVRVALDEALWAAVEAAARARGIAPYLFVEEALTAALGPSETVARLTEFAEAAARQRRDARASATAMEDQIRVISDFIVDLYRAEARANDEAVRLKAEGLGDDDLHADHQRRVLRVDGAPDPARGRSEHA